MAPFFPFFDIQIRENYAGKRNSSSRKLAGHGAQGDAQCRGAGALCDGLYKGVAESNGGAGEARGEARGQTLHYQLHRLPQLTKHESGSYALAETGREGFLIFSRV